MIEGNYLEQHKEAVGGDLYHIDYKHKVLLSTFCVIGNCQLGLSDTTYRYWEKVK